MSVLDRQKKIAMLAGAERVLCLVAIVLFLLHGMYELSETLLFSSLLHSPGEHTPIVSAINVIFFLIETMICFFMAAGLALIPVMRSSETTKSVAFSGMMLFRTLLVVYLYTTIGVDERVRWVPFIYKTAMPPLEALRGFLAISECLALALVAATSVKKTVVANGA